MNEKIADTREIKHQPGAMECLGSQSRQSQRELWIDVAKGISMLAVILGHQGQDQVNRLVFPFHLMMFFLLSGYTLKVKPLTGEYVASKFGRLMKPYFLTCVAVMALDVFNLLLDNRSVGSVTQLVANDLMRSFAGSGDLCTLGVIQLPSRIGAIWFFPATFFAIMGAQLILNYAAKYRYPIGAGLVFLAQMSVSLGWMPFSIQSGMMAVLFLLLGHDIKSCDLLSKIRPIHYVVAAILFAGGVAARVTTYFVGAYMTDPVLSTVVGLSGCLLVYGLSRILSGSRILAYTGRYSAIFLSVHLVQMETWGRYITPLVDNIMGRIPERILQMDHGYVVVHFSVQTGLALILIYAVAGCVVVLSNRWKECGATPKAEAAVGRISSVDMAKGILIVLMIVGHYTVAEEFRVIVYSFYMVGFVVLSGLFYKPCTPLQRLKKDVPTLILPYLIFSVGHVMQNTLVQGAPVWASIRDAALSMSFSKRVFVDVASIGPVYFILMLLLVRVVYSALQTYFPKQLTILVVLGAVCGIWLGEAGWWLPWSLDVALYLLVPYHMGKVIRERGLLLWLKNHPQCYFLLVLPWAYSVSCGGIEIAIRRYQPYTYGILGAVCATLLLYLLCEYVANSAIPQVFQQIVKTAGRHSIWILITHVLLESWLLAPVLTKVVTGENICYLGVAVIFDVAVGCLLGWLYDKATKSLSPKGSAGLAS